jgi:hypothetical protein
MNEVSNFEIKVPFERRHPKGKELKRLNLKEKRSRGEQSRQG